ncbi:MAG: RNA polymerase sigma factor [Pseudolabrys sp.]|jgi:RNA polymerase sigma-70 factor (ECF subfamily)
MEDLSEILSQLYKSESRRILATLIRLLGDFTLAEDALHDAFRAAMEEWPKQGMPKNPRAWLVSAGRFKAIDRIRRQSKLDTPLEAVQEQLFNIDNDPAEQDEQSIADDQLRLIFTCCHPALSPEARSALTLREVCGLTTEEIARAYLIRPTTLAQRIVRAKSRIKDAEIPYEVPGEQELPERLHAVLQVIYLMFNEGYSASSGNSVTRVDLSDESIRLGRLLLDLLPEAEVQGLCALMLLHESRRTARTDPNGDLILLEEQDRSLWNQDLIQEGITLLETALRSGRFGTYTLQAAIAVVHAKAKTPQQTDWSEIVALYNRLLALEPSPVIRLNRAVAVAMRDGPEAGLALIDRIRQEEDLTDYYWLYSAQADLYRRLGYTAEAEAAYRKALDLTQLEPERRYLQKRLVEIC